VYDEVVQNHQGNSKVSSTLTLNDLLDQVKVIKVKSAFTERTVDSRTWVPISKDVLHLIRVLNLP